MALAATLNGRVGIVALKSVVLLFVMELTVRVAVPVFDMVTVCVPEVVPTFWLPKVSVVGDTPMTGTAGLQAGSAEP